MAKRKTKSKKPLKLRDPDAIRRRRKIALHLFGVFLLAGALVWGFASMKRYVEHEVVFTTRPPSVVLKDRPAWMSDSLALQIVNSVKPLTARSAFDRQLLIDATTELQNDPWIKKVRQVRRAYREKPGDTLEIDCDYRAPIALVHWKDFYWLVDGEGVKLPEQFTPEQLPALSANIDPKLAIRTIDGVNEAPVESGRHWPGDDLAAGLDLAKVLYGRQSVQDVTGIDVSNFAGRVDPRESQLVMQTRQKTEIRWGRPINASDFFVEVSTAKKLAALDEIYADYHRPDGGHPWVDLRFDRITYPSEPTADARR